MVAPLKRGERVALVGQHELLDRTHAAGRRRLVPQARPAARELPRARGGGGGFGRLGGVRANGRVPPTIGRGCGHRGDGGGRLLKLLEVDAPVRADLEAIADGEQAGQRRVAVPAQA